QGARAALGRRRQRTGRRVKPVDVVNETKEKAREVASGGREKGSVAKRVLVSLAASAASGVTAYAARKAPGFVQRTLLPKLKELTSNGGALDKAKKAVESAVPAVGGGGQASQTRPRPRISNGEREKRQRERRHLPALRRGRQPARPDADGGSRAGRAPRRRRRRQGEGHGRRRQGRVLAGRREGAGARQEGLGLGP